VFSLIPSNEPSDADSGVGYDKRYDDRHDDRCDDHCVVLIPAHNEQASVAEVVRRVQAALGRCEIVVIDDASSDGTAEVAHAQGAATLSLSLQLGAWGAAQCGIRYALRRDYQIAVTMDADNQHDAACIGDLLQPIRDGSADVVIGAYPARTSHIRRLACRYFRFLTGLRIEDITSGFRAYNNRAMEILAGSEATLLDYQDVGVLLMLRRRGMRIVEVPTPMMARSDGHSRVFSSWLQVTRYMLQTTLLCLARIKN
jgi:glycosyltransferase involved in cell wall biosynthesis